MVYDLDLDLDLDIDLYFDFDLYFDLFDNNFFDSFNFDSFNLDDFDAAPGLLAHSIVHGYPFREWRFPGPGWHPKDQSISL